MNHLEYWQLAESPFHSRDVASGFFQGGTVEEAIARVAFLVESRQRLGLVLGPSGVGRTMFLRNLHLPLSAAIQDRFRIIYLPLRGVSSSELPSVVLSGLRCSNLSAAPLNRAQLWQTIEDEILSLSLLGERVVILCDDIEKSEKGTAEAIWRLMNIRGKPTCIFAIDDTYEPGIEDWVIEESDLRVELPLWDLLQTSEYFEFALDRVDAERGIYESQAVIRIQELGNGKPRRICQLAELSLVAGAVQRVDFISSDIVEQVANEIPGLEASQFALD